MKLGLQLGYWGAQPNPFAVTLAQEAERLGFDSVWTAEAWGSDAFTPLAWIGAHTERIRLCTGIVQISARTPASCAMHALTLDHLSNGRFSLGLGVSGPQVVEGWYGQPFGKPLARTREYVDIVRRVLRREEPVAFAGEHYRLPYDGPELVGARQAAALDHAPAAAGPSDPARRRRPEERRARGRDRRRLAAALLLAVPARGVRRLVARRAPGFEICVTVMGCAITDDVEAGLDADQGRARVLHRRHGCAAIATSTWS